MSLDAYLPLLVILNPVAGGRRSRRVWSQLEPEVRRAVGDLTLVHTLEPGHARQLAQQARGQGYRGLLVLGGDGTLSEVASGLLHAPLPLGIVPAGRGNDFARCLGLPRDPISCWRAIADGDLQSVDMATVNGRPYINIAGAGLDAETANRANRFPKALGGLIPYVTSLIATLVTYSNFELRASGDGLEWSGRASLVAVGNGSHYGGGLHILPGAHPADGLLDVCVAGDLGRVEIVSMLPRVVKGTHVDHPAFHRWRVPRLVLESERELAVQADGEVVQTLPATFEIIPAAIQLLGMRREQTHAVQ